jgi:hypothetical protein
MSYLGRLIARAAPVPPKIATPAPVADPFEAVEHIPALPPPTAPAASTRDEIANPDALASVEAPLRLTPEPSGIVERTIVREAIPEEPTTIPVMQPRGQIAEPIPPAAIETRIERTERVERVIEHRDHETMSLVPRETPLERIEVQTVRVEPAESEPGIERFEQIVSIQPVPSPFTPAAETAVTPAPVVHPQARPIVEKIVEPPAERPALTIGRLIVDVVPTTPTAAPQARRRARPSSGFRTSSDSFFGLGQV